MIFELRALQTQGRLHDLTISFLHHFEASYLFLSPWVEVCADKDEVPQERHNW